MSKIPLGPAELGFITVYLISLIGIGYWGMRARTENSLKDFYLAGSGVGFMVLVLTLYATQYSGNTLFAFTGKTFRIGYAWLMSVHFMTSIIVVYLVFAPKLHRLAKQKNFITPNHRTGDASSINRHFPPDIFRLAPSHRRCCSTRNSVCLRPPPLVPFFGPLHVI